MGLFNFFKSNTPPPLYHHGERGSGNEYLSPMPSEQDPSIHVGNDLKTIKKRVKERVDAEIWIERRKAQMEKSEKSEKRWRERMSRDAEYFKESGLNGTPLPPTLRDQLEGRGGPRDESHGPGHFRLGDHGFAGIADDPRALGFMPMGRRRGGRRNPGWPDLGGMGRGDPPVPDHSFGRGDNSRGGEGRGQEGGRGPRWPAGGGKASAWNMHD